MIVRSLRREYRFHSADEATLEALAYLRADPEMPGVRLEPVDFNVGSVEGFARVELPGVAVFEGAPQALVNTLHHVLAHEVNEEAPGAPLIHGATFVGPEGRVVFIGDKGSGKTTLSLHLLLSGFTMEGDEHVAILADGCLTRPRNLRIKDGSIAVLPALADLIAGAPSLPHPDGGRIYSVSPSAVGRPWRITPSRVTDLVFIEPNHGGYSAMRPAAVDEAFRRLMRNVLHPDRQRLGAVARLRSLVVGARRWKLSLGSLKTAEFHVGRLLSG